MKKVLLTALVSVFGLTAFAQNEQNDLSVGAQIGFYEYNGDYQNELFTYKDLNPAFSFSLAKYISKSFDVFGFASFGEIDGESDGFTFAGDFTAISLNLKYKLMNGVVFNENAHFSPFITLGAGYGQTKFELNDGVESAFILPLGAGLDYWINDRWGVNARITYNYSTSDKLDNFESGKSSWEDTDDIFHHSIGVSYNFAISSDSDGDGVPDNKDRCPETAGSPALMGCPDSDNDGIANRDDFCPNLAGVAEFKGCPDTDGDGIPDKLDNCPELAGPESLQGCPDSDGDGITDGKDWCPNEAGTAVTNGCPDTDGDGVADKDDDCPAVAGLVSNHGCPEMKDAIAANPGSFKTISMIYFASGSSSLNGASVSELERIISIMKENKELSLVIEGHTDDTGDDSINNNLSLKRVSSVTNYLVRNGINPERYTEADFGESMPIVPNNTKEGKAKNRRVVLKLEE